MRETSGGVAIDFIYDADGRPFAMKRNGAYYYYILNLQGDVIRLINSNGATVASYEYDPYGKVISATGSMAAINPLRYRGYYYDQETGLYFLMSRYYDPAICRFINADSFASTGQGILGHNMFAYCNNCPTNCVDHSGTRAVLSTSLWGNVGFLSGNSATVVATLEDTIKQVASIIMNNDVSAVQNAQTAAFYKGAIVMYADLPGMGAAFSYGIIVLDEYYKDAPKEEFADTLNHEYGHFVHFQTIGVVAYTFTTAIPSLIGAGISSFSSDVYENYYSLPWECTADYLGGVERTYAPWANTLASLFYARTLIQSLIWQNNL